MSTEVAFVAQEDKQAQGHVWFFWQADLSMLTFYTSHLTRKKNPI